MLLRLAITNALSSYLFKIERTNNPNCRDVISDDEAREDDSPGRHRGSLNRLESWLSRDASKEREMQRRSCRGP